MRELEMIFTGERPSQPTPREIEESSQRRATMDQRRQDGTDRSAALRAQAELGSSRRESMLRQQNVTQQSRRLNPDLGNTRRTELETDDFTPAHQENGPTGGNGQRRGDG